MTELENPFSCPRHLDLKLEYLLKTKQNKSKKQTKKHTGKPSGNGLSSLDLF